MDHSARPDSPGAMDDPGGASSGPAAGSVPAVVVLEPSRRAGLVTTLHGVCPAEAVPVYLFQDVLQQLLRHARHHDHAGGLLLGRPRHGVAGPFVEIDGFSAAGPVGSNTELAERLAAAQQLHQGSKGPPWVVGWFHCRLAPGPGPTPQDLAIHRSLFAPGWPVMLLVEQGFSRLALFQLSPHRPSSTGFHLVRADLAPSGARFPVAGEPARATIPLHPAGRAGSMEESEDR